MILLLNTATPECYVAFIIDGKQYTHRWQADRTLARLLLRYLEDSMQQHNASWDDIKGIGAYRGPGSFTGLRIGLTVMNTVADAQNIPIVGAMGEAWQDEAIERLAAGENDQIVLPKYGSAAHITHPRK